MNLQKHDKRLPNYLVNEIPKISSENENAQSIFEVLVSDKHSAPAEILIGLKNRFKLCRNVFPFPQWAQAVTFNCLRVVTKEKNAKRKGDVISDSIK